MAVNTAALKTFAPAMRRQLMEAIGRKLDLLLNSQTPDTLSTYVKQIAELRQEEEKSCEQLLERVAYTWFNRLCALRYLDAKGWHPFGCKVLMPADGSETQPELLKLMRSGSLPADLKTFTNEQRLNQLLDGQIPTAIPSGDAQGEVYRELVLAACRSYHHLLPDLFEGLDDASELLLPDDLLTEGSIAGSFRSSISDSDCEDVEIIGWLYQFYISEKKDEVIGKVVKSEDIPAATQLFTPNWIVKYMVQNTIGAQWLATYPDSPLREQMEFYIEPAEQTDEVKAKLAEITPTSLNPEELTLMDPACGSGHILVEAYEIFKAIYLEQGYQLREIPKLILEKNLFGLDIDQRAAQLTIFSLSMKGRSDDRRLFERGLNINVMSLQDSQHFHMGNLLQNINLSEHGLKESDVIELKNIFNSATTLGSLIQIPQILEEKIPKLENLISESCSSLIGKSALDQLNPLAKQAGMLIKKYDAVVANPPYMGGKFQTQKLKSTLKSSYKGHEKDLYTAFIARCKVFAKKGGLAGIMCPNTWMYISTHETTRSSIINNCTLNSLLEMPLTAIRGATVQVCSFVLRAISISRHNATYFRLSKTNLNYSELPLKFKKLLREPQGEIVYIASQELFKSLPRTPLAFWISTQMLNTFKQGQPMSHIAEARQGLATADNNRFVRLWHEVSRNSTKTDSNNRSQAKQSNKKWFPYNKGGDFRKWYGNQEYIVNWENDGSEINDFKPRAVIRNQDYYFLPSITWTLLSSSYFGVRRLGEGFIFDVNGMSLFANKEMLDELLPFMASTVSRALLEIINPTFAFQVGDIEQLPIIRVQEGRDNVLSSSKKLQITHQEDWDSYERSWNFKSFWLDAFDDNNPPNLAKTYSKRIESVKQIINDTKELERDNNSFWIKVYGLEEELSSEVSIDQITLTSNPAYRYGGDASEEEKWQRFQRDSMAELLSYATGCMIGRYSLEHPGLILADSRSNQDEQIAAYAAKIGKPISEIQFKPDADAIIPVLDGEWFEDDIVARIREFLKVTFPESSVAENLRFIEDSIGKDIRKYFCTDFYKDHLQTYKKRPIYWMVQSPAGPSRGGFACLIYLHRYTPDTLLQVLNNYFRPYLQKLEARQEQLERDQNNDSLPKREQTAARKEADKITKVLKECQIWEQDALLPLAQQRIELDLDDGVKVNYLKLQEVLAKIPGLAAKGD